MRVTKAWLDRDTGGIASIDVADVEDMRAFVLDRWRERAAELGRPEPLDLTSSRKFSALFVKLTLGGRIRGNQDHVHNLVGGRRVDLNEGAADVMALPDPHRHDEAFLRHHEFHLSLQDCLPRVLGWVEIYRQALEDRTLPTMG